MRFQVVINKSIHTIEADSVEDAERVLEEQWNAFHFKLCNPTFDLDDLTIVGKGWKYPSLPKLPELDSTRVETSSES